MARGLMAFAAGFGKGWLEGQERKRRQQQEDKRFELEKRRMELQEQRAGLENRKLEREEEMQKKLQSLSEEVKPAAMFIVDTPQGRMHFADEKQAAAAAETAGTQVQQGFVVAGKTFADKDEAADAAEAMKSPAVIMRRKAEIYSSYGREDLANAAMNNYKNMVNQNKEAAREQALTAYAQGDYKQIVDGFNKQFPNGVKAQIVGQDPQTGVPVMQTFRAGKPVGQPIAMTEEWLVKLVNDTPAQRFEIWKAGQELGLRERGVRVQERGMAVNESTGAAQVRNLDARTGDIAPAAADRRAQTNAQVGNLNARTADIPEAAADRRTQADAAEYNAITGRARATAPTISAVPGTTGGLNIVTMPKPVLNPDGTWAGTSPAPTVNAVPGVKHPGAYSADARNSLGLNLPGAPAAPTLDPAAVTNVMKLMQQEAERRKATRQPATNGREVSGLVTPYAPQRSSKEVPGTNSPPVAMAPPPAIVAPAPADPPSLASVIEQSAPAAAEGMKAYVPRRTPTPTPTMPSVQEGMDAYVPRYTAPPAAPRTMPSVQEGMDAYVPRYTAPAPKAKPVARKTRGLPAPKVLHSAVMQAESGGRRYGANGRLLTSPKGAKGEMQVMDSTFTDPGYGVRPARNKSAAERARVGRDYLNAMVKKFGNVPQALAAYNAGPGAVQEAIEEHGDDWLDHLPSETQNYVDKITRNLRRRNSA